MAASGIRETLFGSRPRTAVVAIVLVVGGLLGDGATATDTETPTETPTETTTDENTTTTDENTTTTDDGDLL